MPLDAHFWFPVRKFDDEVGLWKNFRYLEDFLQEIKQGSVSGHTIVFAIEGSDEADRADVICDGTADDVTIQAAYDALNDGDARLVFHQGTYDITGAVAFDGAVIMEGPGTFSFDAAGGGRVTNSGTLFIVDGMRFTGGASGDELVRGIDIDGLFLVHGCEFFSITAKACVRPYHAGAKGSMQAHIAGNVFRDITIAGGGGASPNGVIWADDSSAGWRQGTVMGNTFETVTGNILNTNGGVGAFMCTANNLVSATGGREGTWFHNFISGAYVAGDHAGVDHGTLSGLADDDHTQYLKEKASGGTAAEVPEHDHSAAAEGGTVPLDNLSDVTITTPATDSLLKYDGAAWIDDFAALDELSDVDTTGVADNSLLYYDGATDMRWEITSLVTLASSLLEFKHLTDVDDTIGDSGGIVYKPLGSDYDTLPLGTEGFVLLAGASAPEWEDPTAVGGMAKSFMLGGM